MRRIPFVVPLLLVLAVVLVVARHDTGTTREVADQAPYPRTTRPLPVPEVVIGQGPWKDPLPEPSAGTLAGRGGALPPGFTACASRSDIVPPCRTD